jgi:hypothetical protein
MEVNEAKPSTRMKLFFWFILGSFSVFFAEVVSGSQILAFFTPIDWLLVFPLYTLHTLVLWTVVFRHGRGHLYTLFPAGALFGLYEAYITKVIWYPGWSESPIYVGGIAIVETLLLVLFWHSFMAFIVPLFLAEGVLTSSREVYTLLPGRVKAVFTSKSARRIAILLAISAGIFQSIGAPTPLHSLASGVLNPIFLMALIAAWRRRGGAEYGFRDLLPGPRGFGVLLVLLGADYVILGVLLNPDLLPGIGPQATVWAMYAFFSFLLYAAVRRSGAVVEERSDVYHLDTSVRWIAILTILFTAGSVFGSVTGFGFIFAMLAWVIGISIGLVTLGYTIRQVIHMSGR